MMTSLQVELMRQFVHQKLEARPDFIAGLIVGSVAHGEARLDSDVDCVLVFDEVDDAVVPAEFVWVPATDSYHTIFEVEALEVGGIQIDAKRMSLNELERQDWPDSFRNDLAHGLLIFDRNRSVAKFLEQCIAYPDSVRLSRIRDHSGWAAYYLEEWRLLGWIARGGIGSAHDQLTAAFEEVVKILHAYNREWLPWRYRWIVSTLRLPWLPGDYARRSGTILSRVSDSRESVLERRKEIAALLDDILARLEFDGLLPNPVEAFVNSHPELGYAHNFEAWRRAHDNLLKG